MRIALMIAAMYAISGMLFCGPARQSQEFCDPVTSRRDCDGKLVQVTGLKARHGEQHPLLTVDKKESYWEVGDSGQWIFVSENEINCAARVVVTGTLDAAVGPCDGKAQNKNQYCGTAVYVKSWECK